MPANRLLPCGTKAGYTWHKRHGQPACEPCLEARRAYERQRFAEGKKRDPKPCAICGAPKRPHGRNLCQSCADGTLTRAQETELWRGRKRRYGVTREEYEMLMIRQGGACGLCRRPFTPRCKTPHVDHDHATGVIRGIVHARCNTTIIAAPEELARKMGCTPREALASMRRYFGETT